MEREEQMEREKRGKEKSAFLLVVVSIRVAHSVDLETLVQYQRQNRKENGSMFWFSTLMVQHTGYHLSSLSLLLSLSLSLRTFFSLYPIELSSLSSLLELYVIFPIRNVATFVSFSRFLTQSSHVSTFFSSFLSDSLRQEVKDEEGREREIEERENGEREDEEREDEERREKESNGNLNPLLLIMMKK